MSRSMKAHLLLLAVVFVWGATFVVVKDALADISPLLFNLIRMAVAALCLAILSRGHIGHIDRRGLLYGAIAGLFLADRLSVPNRGLRLTTSEVGFHHRHDRDLRSVAHGLPRLRPTARTHRAGMPSPGPCSLS